MASCPGLVDLVVDRLVVDGLDQVVGLRPLVADHDLQPLVEEGVLADVRGDRLEGVRRGLERVRRGPVGDRRPGLLAGLELADLDQLAVGHAVAEGLPPQGPAVLDLDDQLRRQRVDDRDAHAVQSAGDLVAAAAELAAGVQLGERDRDGGQLLARRGVGRDAATVVLDPDRTVRGEGQHDPVAVAGQGLVDPVVHDLPDQVVQAALAGRADVHARPLADRLEPLEDLDRRGVVLDAVGGLRWVDLGHGHPFLLASRPPLDMDRAALADQSAVRDDPMSMIPVRRPHSTSRPRGWGRSVARNGPQTPGNRAESPAQGVGHVPIWSNGSQIG